MNKRKKVVVEHALTLFLEKGIQQTSIHDIIERASISKGTFYNYFSSKNECLSAILDYISEEVSHSRTEIGIGKDMTQSELLIDQISTVRQLTEKHGLHAVIDEMLHSGDDELKRLVLRYRFTEHEWISGRLVDLCGEELRPYAFEAAIIFFGILHHLLLTSKIINQHTTGIRQAATAAIQYMPSIINGLIHGHTSILDPHKLAEWKHALQIGNVGRDEVIARLIDLAEEERLTKAQSELANALRDEFARDALRTAVIHSLLPALYEEFKGSAQQQAALEVVNLAWSCVRQR